MTLLMIALKNLVQHRLRSAVLVTAIALVTAVMVVMLGVAEGMNRTLIESSTTLMSGHVNVQGFFKVTAGQAAPAVTHYTKLLETVRKAVPEITYVVQRGRGWAKVISDTGSKMYGFDGIEIGQETGLQAVLKMESGKLEDLKNPNTMMLFEDQARELEVNVGDKLTISAPTGRGTNNTVDVTVVAIARNMGLMSQFSSFMNAKTLRELYQFNDDTTGALQLYLPSADMTLVRDVQERLRTALAAAGYELMEDDPRAFFFKFENVQREAWTGQKIDVTNWRDEVSFVSWTVDLMNILAFVMGAVMLAIVGVGIMIVMWISIRERTREIGTLRAIGMQRFTVLRMFVAEGFLLGVFSSSLGAAAGVAFSAAVSSAKVALPVQAQLIMMSERLVIVPTALWAGSTILFITVAVTVISLIPSFIAARLKPVTAMQHVG
jgi:ABC-type lipoprotein release transport system permease subunit